MPISSRNRVDGWFLVAIMNSYTRSRSTECLVQPDHRCNHRCDPIVAFRVPAGTSRLPALHQAENRNATCRPKTPTACVRRATQTLHMAAVVSAANSVTAIQLIETSQRLALALQLQGSRRTVICVVETRLRSRRWESRARHESSLGVLVKARHEAQVSTCVVSTFDRPEKALGTSQYDQLPARSCASLLRS